MSGAVPSTTAVTLGIVVLAIGSFALRAGGAVLRDRIDLGETTGRLLDRGTVVLLVAVALVSALADGTEPAPASRALGVAAGALAAVAGAPLVAVVLTAAATTALVRAIGLA
ncbi:Branched-chain amino acid transport protein (AzlD) [Rathayibacter oskolensis]|uniref:Branched-chain amino acid transport protein (AzlD) n=1 Tax=Rathayibacter oskolensis TaxID=1891671 RepID=A0A1X7MY99_9MICO|nr:AzlD domain-containing protein [Rathayibacter oskolensis]SMH29848.1 Branched-chain amino acid transport protein (AzlD) [Rathayibacter oskolensis]